MIYQYNTVVVSLVQAPELAFQPSLEQDSPGSFYSLVESLLDDIFNFTTLVPRVATHKEMPDYHLDVEEVSKIDKAVLFMPMDLSLKS